MATTTLKALAAGTQKPPISKGALRIYGMRFCPYVHRVRLVLAAKKIPHEVINVHLKSKPDWFLAMTPEGKVPLLEQDEKLLWESLIISDYLDEVYPHPKLWPEDPYEKARARIAMEITSKIGNHFGKIYTEKAIEGFENILNELATFEKYFQQKKTKFFTGDKPGMVDYMIWPFIEISLSLWDTGIYNEKSLVSTSERPLFSAWIERMQNDRIVKKCTPGKELLTQYLMTKMDGNSNYDLGL